MMPNTEDILWFKQQFGEKIITAVKELPFSEDMIVAIACQETGEIWPVLRRRQLPLDKILELCVGDTLDANKGRSAFPKTKDELLSKPQGAQMFTIAHQALVDMAQFITGYQPTAKNPNKFCHGFGIFQYDLQFFLEDPGYFLQKRYADFDSSLGKCITELMQAMKRIGWGRRTSLTDFEMACVAIAYNTGGFNPAKGLRQGHFDGQRYYGEAFFDFLRLSKTVTTEGLTIVPQGTAPVPPPSPVLATGKFYEVDVQTEPLRLRSTPKIDPRNILASLPDGQIVQAVSNKKQNGFLEVETSMHGALLHGFAFAQYLKPATGVDAVPVEAPDVQPPANGIVAVYAPRKQPTVTKRREPANAFSLNEPGQPERKGTTPDELRTELAAIINWLAVDRKTHLRYQPMNQKTFCNIYAHDYAYLAGVYLPRVWWTQHAIVLLTQGQTVQPILDNTIEEVRANGLFRWLRDFGMRFGWRQTGTLNKLQLEVNQGAIGLIVARRKDDGRSGHIVVIVPETMEQQARRDAAGEVVAPLQSQAGVNNFQYGTGKTGWWKGEQFAESAFWIHA